MWAWQTALGVVPANAFEKDIAACAAVLDTAHAAGFDAGVEAAAKCCDANERQWSSRKCDRDMRYAAGLLSAIIRALLPAKEKP